MARGIKRRLGKARTKVVREISGIAQGGKYAAALAGEGYLGGYRDALDDVLLVLNGVTPQRYNWWSEGNDGARYW